jgi:hypothetical protein
MSYHRLLTKLEEGCKAYLAATITGIPTPIKVTDDDDILNVAQYVTISAPTGNGIVGLPGNYAVDLKTEVRTHLSFYADRTAATAAHRSLCGLVMDRMMWD